MNAKKLEPGSKYEHFDKDGDGIVSDEEFESLAGPPESNINEGSPIIDNFNLSEKNQLRDLLFNS